ncbi:hypothetical protein [Erwinia phage vB_Ea_2910A]|nr:hypothetical protein [Erwinia phage vB_Ea_2910A]
MDKVNPLTNKDKKNIEEWRAELPKNIKTFEKYKAEEEAKKAAAAGGAPKKIKISKSMLKSALKGIAKK